MEPGTKAKKDRTRSLASWQNHCPKHLINPSSVPHRHTHFRAARPKAQRHVLPKALLNKAVGLRLDPRPSDSKVGLLLPHKFSHISLHIQKPQRRQRTFLHPMQVFQVGLHRLASAGYLPSPAASRGSKPTICCHMGCLP